MVDEGEKFRDFETVTEQEKVAMLWQGHTEFIFVYIEI